MYSHGQWTLEYRPGSASENADALSRGSFYTGNAHRGDYGKPRASCKFAGCPQCRRYFGEQRKLKNLEDPESDSDETDEKLMNDPTWVGPWGDREGTSPPKPQATPIDVNVVMEA